ncbi:unnamed protein product [[Candida] boidinii]|nr:unnamed protein product [[Candida] boidinii]
MPAVTSTRRSRRLQGSSQELIKYVEISDEDDVELLSAAEEDQAGADDSNDDNDEDQIDQDEDDDYGSSSRKRNKRGRSKSSKAQKSSNTKRRKRNLVSNIDKIEDFQENYIFQALSSSETSIAGLATEWLEEFQESKYGALKDLINFLLRCCGCVTQLNEHDVK